MSLTKEQIESETLRCIALYQEAKMLQSKSSGMIKIIIAFIVLGIFFFPCLVIALLCFALHHFGMKKAKANMEEVHRLEAIPEVSDRLEAIGNGDLP